MKAIISLLFSVVFACGAFAQTTTLTINQSTGQINAPTGGAVPKFTSLKSGTITIESGGSFTASAGSLTTMSGTFGGAPTGGTLNLGNLTLTLPRQTVVAGTSSGPGEIRINEDLNNGTNYAAIVAPASLGSNITLTLPAVTGTFATLAGTETLTNKTISDVRTSHSTLTYGATTAIDFAADGLRTVTLTGDITFTSSNLAAGRTVTVRIVGDGSIRAFTFPGGWKFIGAGAPASLAASKISILTLTSFGTTDADVVAAFSAEP